MNGNEVFSLAERIAKLMSDAEKNKAQAPRPGRSRRPRNFKHLHKMSSANLAEMLQNDWRKWDEITKVIEDRNKATKKEDKKDDKKLKTEHWMAMLVAGYPIIALVVWLLWR